MFEFWEIPEAEKFYYWQTVKKKKIGNFHKEICKFYLY